MPLIPTRELLIELVQDGPGSRLITAFGNKFQFSTGLPLPVLSTAGGTRDLLGFIYRQATDRWMYVGQVFGFT